MHKEKLQNLDLDIYKEVLDNGLIVYICPIERNDVHASIATKYGNDILEYIPIGKKEYKTIPTGTAHFLEHKMFAKEEGPDPMTIFASNGAYGNAYTTAKVTRYYYTGTSHIYENLKTLLDCVTKPYFTKENIAKEQGIIAEEIKAGFDNPEERLYYTTIKSLFKNHPHQYPVAGYIETIKKLTEQDLYDTYNTFYHPSNMFMVITGNIKPEKTIDFIKEYFNNLNYQKQDKIKTKTYEEPNEVSTKRQEVTMDVTNKLITVAYKVKLAKDINKFKNNIYTLLYLDMMFGPMSDFFEDAFKDNNILKNVIYYSENIEDYKIIYFDLEVIDDEKILEKIDKILKQKEYSEEYFELIKKNALKSLVLASENVDNMANLIVGQELQYGSFNTNIYNEYKQLNYQEFKEYIDKLDFSNKTTSVIKK